MVSRRLAFALSHGEYTRPQQSLLPVIQSDPFRYGSIDRYRINGPSYSRETRQSIDADAGKSEQDALHRRENALQGALVLDKRERLELRENILRTFFNHCGIIGLQSYQFR